MWSAYWTPRCPSARIRTQRRFRPPWRGCTRSGASGCASRRASNCPQILAQEIYERLQRHRNLSPARIIEKDRGRSRLASPPARKPAAPPSMSGAAYPRACTDTPTPSSAALIASSGSLTVRRPSTATSTCLALFSNSQGTITPLGKRKWMQLCIASSRGVVGARVPRQVVRRGDDHALGSPRRCAPRPCRARHARRREFPHRSDRRRCRSTPRRPRSQDRSPGIARESAKAAARA